MKKQLTFIKEYVTTEFNKIHMDFSKGLNYFELKIKIPRIAKRKNRVNIQA